MEFLNLIKEKQLEFLRLYTLEYQQRGEGILVFSRAKGGSNANVMYYGIDDVGRTSIELQRRYRQMFLDVEGKTNISFENRMLITLPQFEFSELPEGVETPMIMYFLIMSEKSGRLFQLIPQLTEVAGKRYYYYQMVMDQTPEELEAQKKLQEEESWTVALTDTGKWFKQVGTLALNNPKMFERFRSAQEFREIIGNENEEYGSALAQYLEENGLSERFSDMRNYHALDKIGDPVRFYYPEIEWEISPTTLRYMATLVGIQNSMSPDRDLDGQSVLEIGGGYGGLCAVFAQTVDFESYTVVETDPIHHLAEKYLSLTTSEEDNVNVVESKEIFEDKWSETKWDLVISDCALCELTESSIEEYCSKVLPRCSRAYFVMNVWEENRKAFIINRLCEIYEHVEEYPYLPEHPEWKRYIVVCY